MRPKIIFHKYEKVSCEYLLSNKKCANDRERFIEPLSTGITIISKHLPHLPPSAYMTFILFILSLKYCESISISSFCLICFVLKFLTRKTGSISFSCLLQVFLVYAPLRSAQSRCPLDILCPYFCPYESSVTKIIRWIV